MKKVNIFIAVFIVMAISFNIKAQTPQYDEQINVVAPYEPSVSDANKININPEYVNIELEKEKINYNISSQLTNLPRHKTFGLDPLDPRRESLNVKKHIFYGKFGFGSNIEPYADVYVNSSDNKKLGGGFHVKHNSAWRQMQDVYDNSFSDTDFDIYGKIKFNNNELQARGFYSHNMFNYYGVSKSDFSDVEEMYNKEDNLTKEKLHTYGGEISLSNIKTTKTDYSVLLNYTGFQAGNEFKSHSINLPVNFNYYSKLFRKSKKEDWSIKFLANYNFSTVDFGYHLEKFNNYIFSIEPSYSLHIGAFALKLGLNANFFNDNTTADNKFKANIHPVAEIKTTIVPEAFSLRIGIKGESYRNNMMLLYDLCKYIAPATALYQNNSNADFQYITNEKYNLYGVFDTRFGKYINFSAGVQIIQYDNLPIFSASRNALDSYEGNIPFYLTDFDVNFANLRKVSISADLTLDYWRSLFINFQGKYNIIELNDTEQIQYAYNMPAFEVYALAKYVLPNKKLSFSAQFALLGGIKDVNVMSDSKELIDIPLIYDLGLTCNYKIKTGIDLWLNLNNLLHYKNKLYIYQLYPEYPANVMLGVTFSL
ncbi:MAG: hypothetical protein LBP67_08325 [Bacteroidales bacterium]|jgi:hypothetical protein|nr:hypothetical protein [Bacteroidales bacterium]